LSLVTHADALISIPTIIVGTRTAYPASADSIFHGIFEALFVKIFFKKKSFLIKYEINRIFGAKYLITKIYHFAARQLKLIGMNSKPFAVKYLLPITLVAFFSIALVSWGDQKQTPQPKTKHAVTDTIPKNKVEKKIRDLDDVIDEIDKAELKLNMEKVKTQIEEAMKQIDMSKIQMEMDKAMKEIDMAKVKMDMEKAIKEVDIEKLKAEIEKATKEIDAAKIERDVKESLAKVDWEKMKLQMEEMKEQMAEVKKIDMSKVEEDMKKVEKEMKELGPKIEKEMAKAKVEIEKAKEEMKEYKSFVDGLEKDGLINKKEGYSIQHKNGELIVNGKKQPGDVYNKYRSFLEKHKKFNIKKSDDDFNIDNDDND
jgi:hypothetical protein